MNDSFHIEYIGGIMKFKILLASILFPTLCWSQNLQSYQIEIHDKSGHTVYHSIQDFNPKNISTSNFSDLNKKEYISSCVKNNEGVKNELNYELEGTYGEMVWNRDSQELRLDYKKVAEIKKINLGDCPIEELTMDEVNFSVEFPLIEFEQSIKTPYDEYNLHIKKIKRHE